MQTAYPIKRSTQPRGFALTELVVAAGLLVVVTSVVTSLTVKTGRLRQDTRHYRLAVDELSNQLDWFTSLDEPGRTAALAELSPSPEAQAALPNPVLTAERIVDQQGDRIVLRLEWDRLGRSAPVALVGWIDPLPAPPTDDAEEDEL